MPRLEIALALIGAVAGAAALTGFVVVIVRTYQQELRGDPVGPHGFDDAPGAA